MFKISYICILVSVAVFCPFPTWEHFIWPLSYCVLADICNHTWIPECGIEKGSDFKRLFIDECDMWEFNCDNLKDFSITNYSSCFTYDCLYETPKSLRMGDYRFDHNRKVVYDPVRLHTTHSKHHHHTTQTRRTTTRPMLPPHMLRGKRRHTPEYNKKRILRARTNTDAHIIKPCSKDKQCTNKKQLPEPITTKTTPNLRQRFESRSTKNKPQQKPKPSQSQTKKTFKIRKPTVLLKKMMVLKNGQMMQKVFKGYAANANTKDERESGFLE